MTHVHWLDEPQEHDYPAAAEYLELLADPDTVDRLIARLHRAAIVHKRAKDILRSSRLELLPASNTHVERDLAKIIKGEPLSPILLIRGTLGTGAPAQIADGYHRVCASYYADENTEIPAKIAAPD